MKSTKQKTTKAVDYSKWGYIFLAPFFVVFLVFNLIPLVSTFYNSFFENYRSGLKTIGPNFVGLKNYIALFTSPELGTYFKNTMILWILGFIPQIIVSLALASWFCNSRLRLKCQAFFKTVIYMPNLIMASAFAMLFFALFADKGPVNLLLMQANITKEPIRFLSTVWGTRGLIASMNFLMWFGNTTILLMSAVLGISPSVFEAAEIDGASSTQTFFKVTLPLIKPILIYVMITSLIGGLQMFDVPQVLTGGSGAPNNCSKTLIMFLNEHLFSKNYGMAGALSVILFIISVVLSVIVFFVTGNNERVAKAPKMKKVKEAKANESING